MKIKILTTITSLIIATSLNARTPHNLSPIALPAAIEFEHFDDGVPASSSTWALANSHYDSTSSNAGGKYKDSSVDIASSDDMGGGYCLTNCASTDWLNYTIFVPETADFDIQARINTKGNAASFTVSFYAGESTTAYASKTHSQTHSTGWRNVGLGTQNLPAGQYTMKVSFDSTNSTTCLYNYLEFIPKLPTIQIGSGTVDMSTYVYSGKSLTSADVDDPDIEEIGLDNATVLQAAITSINSSGGTVYIPSGIYVFRQNGSPTATDPVEDALGKNQDHSTAVRINQTGTQGIRITGTNNSVILKGLYRSTTIIGIGVKNGGGASVTNVLIDNITFIGRPEYKDSHINKYTGHGIPVEYNIPIAPNANTFTAGLGTLLVIQGNISNPISSKNICVADCNFVNPGNRPILLAHVKNVNISNNSFTFMDGIDEEFWDGNLTLPNRELGAHCAIFGGAARCDYVVVTNNYFNGNVNPTATVGDFGSDGLIWLSSGGYWYVADNTIDNYFLEGIQYGAGPAASVRNSFNTDLLTSSTVAFAVYGSDRTNTLSTVDSILSSFSIIGNTITNGNAGIFARGDKSDPTTTHMAPFDLIISGNYIDLVDESLNPSGAPCTAINIGTANCVLISGCKTKSEQGVVIQRFGDSLSYSIPTKVVLRCNSIDVDLFSCVYIQQGKYTLTDLFLDSNILDKGPYGNHVRITTPQTAVGLALKANQYTYLGSGTSSDIQYKLNDGTYTSTPANLY